MRTLYSCCIFFLSGKIFQKLQKVFPRSFLFDRFYTVENAKGSTGLGISIARLLTEKMGGSIAASWNNGYLVITLFFPL